MERAEGKRRQRRLKRRRSHDDGIQGACHHAEDAVNRLRPEMLQAVLYQLDDRQRAGDYAEPEKDKKRNVAEVQMENLF